MLGLLKFVFLLFILDHLEILGLQFELIGVFNCVFLVDFGSFV
jgi:hypothetical protein